MPVVSVDKLIALQSKADSVRNICVLAHVDHGKTSLTDSLLATNGIISPKLAGKVRYLDSRPDEQLRGITMESSAISLYFSLLKRASPEAQPEQKEYLINLIDSPGHIDFSSEVSTASRLCDGAIVLVDAVEGVCSQTVTVLREAWVERLKPILVINKVDRLITELKMSPAEAYSHLSKLLEQVNAVQGSFFQGERMEDDMKWRERMEEKILAAAAAREKDTGEAQDLVGASLDTSGTNTPAVGEAEYEERDDEDLYFEPERNNVIFASAIDGWAFTIRQFAVQYEKKLGFKRSQLQKVLWGDFYLDPKTKRAIKQKHLKGRNLKPMFVQFVLEPIWMVYEATLGGNKGKGDPELIEKITKSLSVTIPPHILRSRDSKVLMNTIFSSWLPLSTAVLVSVIEYIPSPPSSQAARMSKILDASPGASSIDANVRRAVLEFDTSASAPKIAFVSKVVAIPESELPENKKKAIALSTEEAQATRERIKQRRLGAVNGDKPADGETTITNTLEKTHLNGTSKEDEDPDDPEHLIGFARLYSGSLSVGDELYVLPPKFSPANPHASPEPVKITVDALYLWMGRSIEALKTVPAGVVFGIGGLDGNILKSGTLCSQIEGGANLAGLSLASKPIVRVALEPENPVDLQKMIQGMKMLEQSDPSAEYEVLESGEHVILTAGELHLERCLKDLRERFAKVAIQAGEAIVPYRETIVHAAEMAPPKDKNMPRGTVLATTASKLIGMQLRTRPIPSDITDYLAKHAETLRHLSSERRAEDADGPEVQIASDHLSKEDFTMGLRTIIDSLDKEKERWKPVVDRIVAFGPRREGPNLLIDMTEHGVCRRILKDKDTPQINEPKRECKNADVWSNRDFEDKISYAFQLATFQGPLCNEPMQGVAVFVEKVHVDIPPEERENVLREKAGRLTSEIIKTVQNAIHQGFLDWSPRMMLAMYSCEIQASTEVLGKVYGVITRRRGRIVSEAMNEGTPFYTILSLLPVAESFGFSDEIRKRTAGAASPQLLFAGYEILDQDPYWVPFTEDQLEDLGELADRENVAKRYMDNVRRRKGLFVKGKKLVENAEKQKTLKK